LCNSLCVPLTKKFNTQYVVHIITQQVAYTLKSQLILTVAYTNGMFSGQMASLIEIQVQNYGFLRNFMMYYNIFGLIVTVTMKVHINTTFTQQKSLNIVKNI